MRNSNSITTYLSGFAVALCLPLLTIAQQGVVSGTISHEGAVRPALVLELNMPKDDSKDRYKDFMKDRYGVRVKGLGFLQNKDLVSVEQETVPQLHSKAMDLYAFFEELENDKVRVKLFGRDGYDLYFGPDHAPEVQEHLIALLRDYKVFALEAYYTELLEEQNDKKKDLIDDQEDATDAIKDNKEEIEANLKDNKKRREKIEELEKEKQERAVRLEEIKQDIARSKAELPVSK